MLILQSWVIYRLSQTIALGYSKFCELFTEQEWRGFDYSYVFVFLLTSLPNQDS